MYDIDGKQLKEREGELDFLGRETDKCSAWNGGQQKHAENLEDQWTWTKLTQLDFPPQNKKTHESARNRKQ